MPILETLGAAIVAAATIGFNPMGYVLQNSLWAGIATVVAGLAILYFAKEHKWIKAAGAGVAIAGVVVVLSPYIAQMFGKSTATSTSASA